jgi:hypothetical protein
MNSLETLLISAIVALVGGIVGLWRMNNSLQNARQDDQKEASRLIFATLQRLALERGQRPPSTISTSTNPNFIEAKSLAMKELNGEIENLLQQYLDSQPPTKPGKKP